MNKPFSLSQFRSVLVERDVIPPEAIDDAEGYDAGRMMGATRLAYEDLTAIAASVQSKGPGYSACGGCSPESTSDYDACDGCQFNARLDQPATPEQGGGDDDNSKCLTPKNETH